MIDKVAKDAAGDANASSHRANRRCDGSGRHRLLPADHRKPLSRSVKSDRDVPLADFAKLFAPGGVIDKFLLSQP